jgi:hypothetical protein
MVLHLQADCKTSPGSAGEICAIAVLADKYNCIKALRYAARVWMQDVCKEGDCTTIEHNIALVEAAWLLEDPWTFRTSTKELVLKFQAFEFFSLSQRNSILPESITKQLLSHVARAVDQIAKHLYQPISYLTTNATAGTFPHEEHGYQSHNRAYRCGKHDWMLAANYGIALTSLGLDSHTLAKASIAGIQAGLVNGLEGGSGGEGWCNLRGIVEKVEKCRACSFNTKDHFMEVLKIIDKAHGLCLDCAKNESTSCNPNSTICRKSG